MTDAALILGILLLIAARLVLVPEYRVPPPWVRVVDDGAERYYSVSYDGHHWLRLPKGMSVKQRRKGGPSRLPRDEGGR